MLQNSPPNKKPVPKIKKLPLVRRGEGISPSSQTPSTTLLRARSDYSRTPCRSEWWTSWLTSLPSPVSGLGTPNTPGSPGHPVPERAPSSRQPHTFKAETRGTPGVLRQALAVAQACNLPSRSFSQSGTGQRTLGITSP
jgi:hypothetical protein